MTASLGALFVMAALGLVIVALPTAMAMPFSYHTPDVIERIYTVRAWGSIATLAMALFGTFLTIRLWRERSSLRAPIAGLIALAVVLFSAVFANQQPIEWMLFAPIETVEFDSAAAATHVDERDYVMAVSVADESRAYPILMVAYYHIVHDEIAGEPYVVTY